MTNKVTIIIEGNDGRLECEYASVYEQSRNKRLLVNSLKCQFQDILDNDYTDFNLTLKDFEFQIFEDLTEKYS
jgi:hypothetical protein